MVELRYKMPFLKGYIDMKKGMEIKGLPVIELKTGEKVGNCKSIIFNVNKKKILGITFKLKENIQSSKIVLLKDIESFGENAITIKCKKSVLAADNFHNMPEIIKEQNKIIDSILITDKGKEIGTISDIIFDESDGKIYGFEISDGLIKDIIEGRGFLPFSVNFKIGTNALIIDENDLTKIQPVIGGLKKLLL